MENNKKDMILDTNIENGISIKSSCGSDKGSIRGDFSKSPLITPQALENGDNNSNIKVSNHFDYFTMHLPYLLKGFEDEEGYDIGTIGLIHKLCKALKLPLRYSKCVAGKGFKKGIVISESIHLFFGQTWNENENYDCMRVDIKGHEWSMFLERGGDPKDLYNLKKEYRGKMKQLDLAKDLFTPFITLEEIKDKLDKGEISTCAKKCRDIPDKDLDGNLLGRSIYIGKARESSRHMNIYDKLLEQIDRGNIPQEDYWLRFELRLSNSMADKFADKFFNSNNPEEEFNKAFKDFCDFKETISLKDSQHCHKSRKETWAKWDKLLNYCSKDSRVNNPLPLNKNRNSTMADKEEWLIRSSGKTLAMIYYSFLKRNSEIGFKEFLKSLQEIVINGLLSITASDLTIIENDLYDYGYVDQELSLEDVIKEAKNVKNVFYKAIGMSDTEKLSKELISYGKVV